MCRDTVLALAGEDISVAVVEFMSGLLFFFFLSIYCKFYKQKKKKVTSH